MNQQQPYISFIKDKNVSVFATDWWLNAVCGNENWNAIISKKNNSGFAFHQKNKFFQNAILPSILTPYQPFINFDEEIIASISKYNFVELFCKNYTEADLLLLKKYQFDISYKSNRYLDCSNLDVVYSNFKPTLKRQIKKAEETLTIVENGNLNDLFDVCNQVFARQNIALPYTFEQLKSVDDAASINKSRFFLIAYNADNKPCAAIYVVFDQQYCYYLIGGIATEFKNTGAMSLLIWQAIKFANANHLIFDFCGSTIPSIDKFFSTFNAAQQQILVINKYSNPLQKWLINKLKK
jgi:lipid II:glycine glycyltransferase (peptidoglycan interpeptide bridge formation enzyme)